MLLFYTCAVHNYSVSSVSSVSHSFYILLLPVCILARVLYISSVRSLSHVRLFVTSWTAGCQASLFITNSQSLLKLMSIELVMPPNYLIFCCPLLFLPSIFPRIRVFSYKSDLLIRWPKYLASALPMNIQGCFLLRLTALISLLSKGHSRVFSSTRVQKHQFFVSQPSLRSNFHINTLLLEKI